MPRRARAVAALLAAAIGIVGCGLADTGNGRTAAPAPHGSASPSPTEAALGLLVTRATASFARHEALPPDVVAGEAARRALAALADRMREARVEGLTLSLVPGSVTVNGGQATGRVAGSVRIDDAWPDGSPLTMTLRASRTSAGWRLTGLTDDMPQPWDLPSLRRLDVDGVVVLGDAAVSEMRWYGRAAASAWRDAGRVWAGRPPGRPVVVVPRSTAAFAQQVGRTAGEVDQVAAMTVGSLEDGRTSRGDRVVVNPSIRTKLTDEGRRTILRHELIHVAIRGSTTGTVPQWLTEGYATQGSWTSDVPVQLQQRARAWTPAQRSVADVPTDEEVERTDVAHSYDVAAVLVDDLVARHGRARVQAFYRAMASGAGRDAAARAALGEPFSAVVRNWHAAMNRVAGS